MAKTHTMGKKMVDIHFDRPLKFEEPVVVIPAEEYEDLLEDIDALKSKSLLKELKKEREKIEKGEFVTLKELKRKYGL